MTIKEILAYARSTIAAGDPSPEEQANARGVLELLDTPPECGWPEPEIHTDENGKYVVWEVLGLVPIPPVDLRAIVAMLGRALAEIES